MSVEPDHLDRLLQAVDQQLPREWPALPRGWRGEAEAALIDAVFSARARYGDSPSTGVRGIVGRWRAQRSPDNAGRLDDLRQLARVSADDLACVLKNHQRVPGPRGMTKAQAVIEAAGALVRDRFVDSAALVADGLSGKASIAYQSVPGLGKVTWTYMMMLLGVPGVKADTWVCAFVNEAVGTDRPLGPSTCADLVLAAAESLTADPIHLDHAIWAHRRRQ